AAAVGVAGGSVHQAASHQPVDQAAGPAVGQVELGGEVVEAQPLVVRAGEAQERVELGPGQTHAGEGVGEAALEPVVGLDEQPDGGDPRVVERGARHDIDCNRSAGIVAHATCFVG